MVPTAGAEEETAGPDAMRPGLTFEFDHEFAAQNIEGLILTVMRMRRRARPRRNHDACLRLGSLQRARYMPSILTTG